jgi:lipoyl(octanoyl) transferase
MDSFAIRDLGLMDYKEAWKIQLDTHAAVVSGNLPPTLLLVEHPAVITFGKKGGRENLLVREDFLLEKGFSLYDIERGGDITYHGPGQLVGYPIFKIGRNVQWYLRTLEQVMIDTLADYGFESEGSPGYAGVWVKGEKIVSIGVAIKRNVSFHGFAFNVSTTLAHFNYIVPCGLVGKQMTSLSSLLNKLVSLDEIKPKLLEHMSKHFSNTEFKTLSSSL